MGIGAVFGLYLAVRTIDRLCCRRKRDLLQKRKKKVGRDKGQIELPDRRYWRKADLDLKKRVEQYPVGLLLDRSFDGIGDGVTNLVDSQPLRKARL